jgi:hypothetical protein
MEIKTICRDCIFATYRDGKQRGCSFDDRLYTFKQQKRATRHKNGYFVIDGMCNSCRDEEWGKEHGKNKAKVRREIQVKVDYILLALKPTTAAEIVEKIEVAITPVKCPSNIIIVLSNINNFYNELYTDVAALLKTKKNKMVKYCIVHVHEPDVSEFRAVDLAYKNVRSQYYAVFDTSLEMPKNYVTLLDNLINKELRKVSMIETDEGIHGLVVQSLLHKTLKGSIPQEAELEDEITLVNNVVEKIKYLAKAQNKEEMICKL